MNQPKNDLLSKIQNELSRYTYKHNIQLSATENRFCTFELRLTGYIVDVRSGCENTIHVVQTIYPEDLQYDFDTRFMYKVEDLIRQFEHHEFQEWFKYDGQCVYNPHPELGENK